MVTAIIPAFQAETTIQNVVSRCMNFVDKVIVVDDGSTDNTALLAEKAGAQVITHERNKGKAEAIKSALKRSSGSTVMLDADLQHLPEEIPKLIEPITHGHADLVVGSRFLGNPRMMPAHRKLTNKLSQLAVQLRTGQRITDVQSGFRAFNNKIRKLNLSRATRYEIETIMLYEAIKNKLKIVEVPITTIYGKPSYFNSINDTLSVIKALLIK